MEGRYANYFEIGHNAFEFLLDFGQLYFEAPESMMHSRIVVSPFYAGKLLGVLQRAVRQYEQSYGKITDESEQMEPQPAKGARDTRVLKMINPGT